jgi:hypothetical protein
MDMRQLAPRYNRLVEDTWRELPMQVSSFIQEVAAGVSLAPTVVQAAVFELLPFENMGQLQRFCDVMAMVFLPLSQRWPDTALPEEAGDFNIYTDALVQAALAAASDGGLAFVGKLPLEVDVSAPARPYEVDQCQALGHSALQLRETLLEGFTVYAGKSLSTAAMRYALDLADVLARSHIEEVPQLASWILEARGALPVEPDDIEALWEAPDEETAIVDWSWIDPESDPHIAVRAEELAEENGGNAAVARLRFMTRGFSLVARQMVEDDAYPALSSALAFAPGHAIFQVRAVAEGPQDYLVPRVSRYAYVPNITDIAALLRCSGSIPVMADLVSLEMAEELDCQDLAGWYRLDWSQCF